MSKRHILTGIRDSASGSTERPIAALPQLYRGDSDLDGKKWLRVYWNDHEILMTKLGRNQGNGRAVMQMGLTPALNAHSTLANWEKTHFLSFSESQDVALEFLTKGHTLSATEVGEADQWNGHLISFDHNVFHELDAVEAGLYVASWSAQHTPLLPVLGRFSLGVQKHTILLVDVVTYLGARNSLHLAPCATKQREWVVLPSDPMRDPNTYGELLAQISYTFVDRAKFYHLE